MKQEITWKKIKDYFSHYKTTDMGIQYAIDVYCFEKYYVSSYVKKACMRHLLFLYRFLTEPDFKFVYNYKMVKIAYAFFKLQIIPESMQRYKLPPYRAFILSVIVGWRYRDNQLKLITQEFMDTEGRKNGKSTFNAIFANYIAAGMLNDGLPQVFLVGPSEKSSRIVYKLCSNLITYNPLMKSEFSKNNRDVIKHNKGGEITKLPYEKSAIEGQNPSLVILTEFHLHPDSEMQESARTAFNESRNSQIIIYDTTKGQSLDVPYYQLEHTFKKYLDNQIDNPNEIVDNYNVFLFCAELDADKYDEWDNPKHWAQANPNIGITLSLDEMEKQFKMLATKQELLDFKVKKIGMWINQSEAYFEIAQVLESQRECEKYYKQWFIETDDYKNLNCVLGLDLSNSKDTTALIATWEIPMMEGDNILVIKHLGFIPRKTAQEKERIDKVPYLDWESKGYCNIESKDTIDYNIVSLKIKEWCEKYNVSKLCYDDWQFRFIKDKIIDTTILSEKNLSPIKQGVALTPAIKEFERRLINQRLYIVDENAMLINHLMNLSLKETRNANGNFYPEKISATKRIDGIIATFTALADRYSIDAKASGGNFYSLFDEK